MKKQTHVKSSIPRGFSRFYVLHLLKEKPSTGSQIIDQAIAGSKGLWKPSPGLVYPLLKRLLSEGLIEESNEEYIITNKGIQVLEQYSEVQDEINRQFQVMGKLNLAGKFFAQNLVDRAIGVTSIVSENIDKLGSEQKSRYKSFLENELRRLEKEKTSKTT
tara:strand:+ start:52 stop:534 length:483 start_codon:yes stop_codon:yes gene_type:complete